LQSVWGGYSWNNNICSGSMLESWTRIDTRTVQPKAVNFGSIPHPQKPFCCKPVVEAGVWPMADFSVQM
jgi:hypothetical protein